MTRAVAVCLIPDEIEDAVAFSPVQSIQEASSENAVSVLSCQGNAGSIYNIPTAQSIHGIHKALIKIGTLSHFLQVDIRAGIKTEHGNQIPYYLFYSSRKSAARQHFQDGVESVLRAGGCEIKKFERHGDGSIRKIVEELVYPESAQAVIIALDAETLLETAQILADSSVYPEHVSGLYGRGTATPLLNYLDRGVISGLSVTDDFNTGYLSVRRAVEILSNQKTEEETVLESYYIRKEDLRSQEFEKMLYPIE